MIVSPERKASKLRELFPQLTVEQCRSVLSETSGDVDEAVFLAIDLIEDSHGVFNGHSESLEPEVSYDARRAYSAPSTSSPARSPPLGVAASSAKITSLAVSLKLMVSKEGLPKRQIFYNIKKILQMCDCDIQYVGDVRDCLQAAYEEQSVEISATVRLDHKEGSDHQRLIEFAQKFVSVSGHGLWMQPAMEIRNIDKIFSDVRADHGNVDIGYVAFGNMPNPGTFFFRGEFISRYNTVSNRNITNAIRETGMNNAAGCHRLLSWAHFEHDKRLMTIYFAVENVPCSSDGLLFTGYKIVAPYSSFLSVIVDTDSDPTERNNYIFIHLRHPPQLWEAIPRKILSGKRILNMEICRDWIRVLQWAGNSKFAGCSQETLAYSQWFAFSVPKETVKPEKMFAHEEVEWNKRSLVEKMAPTRQLFEIIARWKRRTKCRIAFASVLRVPRREPIRESPPELNSFRAMYAIEALLGRGSVVTDQLFGHSHRPERNLFYERIQHASLECLHACEEALDAAVCAIDERRRISLLSFFETTYTQKLQTIRRIMAGEEVNHTADVPLNCVLVRKVMATPLRLILLPPEVMMTNRVIRHFGEEYALRCVFRDDNGQKISLKEFSRGRAQQDQSLIVTYLVHRTLSEGIWIASRHYQFLAWSNSQMRDHGCYMYADATIMDPNGEEVLHSIEDIRRWMGDFSSCKSAPKLMSRMGQCFTQAQPTLLLERGDWRVEDDVVGGIPHPETHELFTFSDGVGRISQSLAEKVAAHLDLKPVPSCFQVRFKGFKGVLCVDPILDLEGRENIVFRRSQKKFDEEDAVAELEVVKHSMPSDVCLNRPLIMILDQVTQKQSVAAHERLCTRIKSLLEKELTVLASMMIDENDATEALSTRLSLPIDFRQLHNNGFTFTDEPFFRGLLLAVHRYNIRMHLSKSKIQLPGSMGRTLYGVIDETGLLQYGQVFIRYSPSCRNASENAIVHTGPVLVTKNPCHVPGDVRMFNAVYQDALCHLRDVIVFPRYGPRPHPDEMAGSDLDGDEYLAIFDSDLFFDYNEEPMYFPKTKACEYDSTPTTEDMVDFFLKYLNQDSIGRMSNAHLIMADRKGLFDEVCESIARKCSVAVDFPKSGEPAEPLLAQEQCDYVPDYMQSSVKPSYRSTRLTGQLYRKAKKVEDIVELVHSTSFENKCDPHLYDEEVFEKNKDLVKKAIRLRDAYNAKIQQLLDEYGILDEQSVVSGHCVTIKRITEMERDDYSYYHSDRIVELRYSLIFDSFRKEFFKEFGDESDFVTIDAFGQKGVRCNSALITKAKVWYAVVYNQRSAGSSRFRSFPWIVWDLLLVIKRRALLETKPPTVLRTANPLSLLLTTAIERYCDEHSAEMRSFTEQLCHGEHALNAYKRYIKRYGRKLEMLAFVVDNWLSAEGVYEVSVVNRSHVVLLLLQYGIGIAHGKQSATSVMRHCHFLSERVDQMPNSSEQVAILYDLGEILLCFVRYLASEQFAHARFIRFRLGGMGDDGSSPMLFRNTGQWALLNAVAFRAFQHVALTAGFESFHLSTSEDTAWDFGESDSPNIVSAEMYSQNGLNLLRFITSLKKWSGVDEIMYRPTVRDNLMISCTGNVAARQRLRRLLLIEPSRLSDCISADIVPPEARDESL